MYSLLNGLNFTSYDETTKHEFVDNGFAHMFSRFSRFLVVFLNFQKQKRMKIKKKILNIKNYVKFANVTGKRVAT